MGGTLDFSVMPQSQTRAFGPFTPLTSCAIVAVLLIAILSACAAPIGVKRVDPKKVQREITSDVLMTGKLSSATANLLRYAELFESYAKKPAEVIELLHKGILTRALAGERVSRAAMVALA